MKRQGGTQAEEPAALRRCVDAVRVKRKPSDDELASAVGSPHHGDGGAAQSAAEAKVEECDGTYDCLICSESVRGKEAQRCSACTCQPWHMECSRGLDKCPVCARCTVVPWDGRITAVDAPEQSVDLTVDADADTKPQAEWAGSIADVDNLTHPSFRSVSNGLNPGRGEQGQRRQSSAGHPVDLGAEHQVIPMPTYIIPLGVGNASAGGGPDGACVSSNPKSGLHNSCAQPQKCRHGKMPVQCHACARCVHGKQRQECRDCNAASRRWCPHNKRKHDCNQCSGCPHNRVKRCCKDCNGSAVCAHGRLRKNCRECCRVSLNEKCPHGCSRNRRNECRGLMGCHNVPSSSSSEHSVVSSAGDLLQQHDLTAPQQGAREPQARPTAPVPARLLAAGSKVVAHFAGRKGCVGWYDATIVAVNADADTYEVCWDDGEKKDTCKQAADLCLHLKQLQTSLRPGEGSAGGPAGGGSHPDPPARCEEEREAVEDARRAWSAERDRLLASEAQFRAERRVFEDERRAWSAERERLSASGARFEEERKAFEEERQAWSSERKQLLAGKARWAAAPEEVENGRAAHEEADSPPPPPLVPRPSNLCCPSAQKYYSLYKSAHDDLLRQRRQLENDRRSGELLDALHEQFPALHECVTEMVGRPDDGSEAFAPVRFSTKRLLASIRTLAKRAARTPREIAVLQRQRAIMEESRLRHRQMQEGLHSTLWPALQYLSKHEEPVMLKQPTRYDTQPARIVDSKGDPVTLCPSGFHVLFGDVVYLQIKTAARPSALTCKIAIQKALREVPGVMRRGAAAGDLPEFSLFGPECASVDGITVERDIIPKKLALAAQYADKRGWIRDFFLHLEVPPPPPPLPVVFPVR